MEFTVPKALSGNIASCMVILLPSSVSKMCGEHCNIELEILKLVAVSCAILRRSSDILYDMSNQGTGQSYVVAYQDKGEFDLVCVQTGELVAISVSVGPKYKTTLILSVGVT